MMWEFTNDGVEWHETSEDRVRMLLSGCYKPEALEELILLAKCHDVESIRYPFGLIRYV